MRRLGFVVSLHVASAAAAPMETRDQLEAVTGRGFAGDRYYTGSGTYSRSPGNGRPVTLIEVEAIAALRRDYGIDIMPAQTRRNIVTHGLALNHLVEREFLVGAIRLRGTRLCEPCLHLEQLSKRGALRGLVHRGGLRAEILSGGTIHTGDGIAVLDHLP